MRLKFTVRREITPEYYQTKEHLCESHLEFQEVQEDLGVHGPVLPDLPSLHVYLEQFIKVFNFMQTLKLFYIT